MNKKCYLDMDGLLCDFDQEFFNRHGISPHDLRGKPDADFWGKFNENPTNFYRNMPVLGDALWFVKRLRTLAAFHRYDLEILTAVPRMSSYPTAAQEKQEWCVEHGLGDLTFNTGPHSVDKQRWCQPGDILVDDNSKNIRQWMSKGGYGIFHYLNASFYDTYDAIEMAMIQQNVLDADPGF